MGGVGGDRHAEGRDASVDLEGHLKMAGCFFIMRVSPICRRDAYRGRSSLGVAPRSCRQQWLRESTKYCDGGKMEHRHLLYYPR